MAERIAGAGATYFDINAGAAYTARAGNAFHKRSWRSTVTSGAGEMYSTTSWRGIHSGRWTDVLHWRIVARPLALERCTSPLELVRSHCGHWLSLTLERCIPPLELLRHTHRRCRSVAYRRRWSDVFRHWGWCAKHCSCWRGVGHGGAGAT